VGPDGTLAGSVPPPPEPGPGQSVPAAASMAAPEPAAADPAGQAALVELNHLVQLGYLTGITWSFDAEGPAHARTFRAVATGRLSGVSGVLTAVGSASSKAAAKAAAARALLEVAAQQNQ
jgi:dsRNA-specific ribonuclease